MCWDLDAEILLRIRSGQKAFIIIKDVLMAKQEKTVHADLFNSFACDVMHWWDIGYNKKERTATGFDIEGYGKIHARNIVM